MAFTKLVFENPLTGQMREAPVGFAWTVLFFGFFPPMFRGDWKYCLIMFLCMFLTWGLAGLVFMFIYNKLYIKELIGQGFKVSSTPYPDIEHLNAKLGLRLPVLEAKQLA
jgi:hypothetical protein